MDTLTGIYCFIYEKCFRITCFKFAVRLSLVFLDCSSTECLLRWYHLLPLGQEVRGSIPVRVIPQGCGGYRVENVWVD